jgi:hypothetical protein
MTKLELLPAALIAAALLTAPAVAQEYRPYARNLAASAQAGAAPGMRYVDGRLCYPAPRVGAFATQPWENETPCQPAPVYY